MTKYETLWREYTEKIEAYNAASNTRERMNMLPELQSILRNVHILLEKSDKYRFKRVKNATKQGEN